MSSSGFETHIFQVSRDNVGKNFGLAIRHAIAYTGC